MQLARALLAIPLAAGIAHADPDPAQSNALPQPPFLTLPIPMLVEPTPEPPPVSLRLEAARVAAEVFEDSWRYPPVAPILGASADGFWLGPGLYRPRSARSAALHGGAMGATLLGEILLGSGSPLAGLGAMVAGATLDAAAADADRDAEAQRR